MELSSLWNVLSCCGKSNDSSAPDQVSKCRRLLPQFLSTIPLFLMSYDLGLALSISTIVVPSVLGTSELLNPDETISMTPGEASWLGKLCYA